MNRQKIFASYYLLTYLLCLAASFSCIRIFSEAQMIFFAFIAAAGLVFSYKASFQMRRRLRFAVSLILLGGLIFILIRYPIGRSSLITYIRFLFVFMILCTYLLDNRIKTRLVHFAAVILVIFSSVLIAGLNFYLQAAILLATFFMTIFLFQITQVFSFSSARDECCLVMNLNLTRRFVLSCVYALAIFFLIKPLFLLTPKLFLSLKLKSPGYNLSDIRFAQDAGIKFGRLDSAADFGLKPTKIPPFLQKNFFVMNKQDFLPTKFPQRIQTQHSRKTRQIDDSQFDWLRFEKSTEDREDIQHRSIQDYHLSDRSRYDMRNETLAEQRHLIDKQDRLKTKVEQEQKLINLWSKLSETDKAKKEEYQKKMEQVKVRLRQDAREISVVEEELQKIREKISVQEPSKDLAKSDGQRQAISKSDSAMSKRKSIMTTDEQSFGRIVPVEKKQEANNVADTDICDFDQSGQSQDFAQKTSDKSSQGKEEQKVVDDDFVERKNREEERETEIFKPEREKGDSKEHRMQIFAGKRDLRKSSTGRKEKQEDEAEKLGFGPEVIKNASSPEQAAIQLEMDGLVKGSDKLKEINGKIEKGDDSDQHSKLKLPSYVSLEYDVTDPAVLALKSDKIMYTNGSGTNTSLSYGQNNGVESEQGYGRGTQGSKGELKENGEQDKEKEESETIIEEEKKKVTEEISKEILPQDKFPARLAMVLKEQKKNIREKLRKANKLFLSKKISTYITMPQQDKTEIMDNNIVTKQKRDIWFYLLASIAMIGVGLGFICILFLIAKKIIRDFWLRRLARVNPGALIIYLYHNFRLIIGKLKFEQNSTLTPFEFARWFSTKYGWVKDNLLKLTDIFVRVRYSHHMPTNTDSYFCIIFYNDLKRKMVKKINGIAKILLQFNMVSISTKAKKEKN